MATPDLEALPKALSEHSGYLLVRLGKHAQRLFSVAIEPLELRPPHCDILLTLAERGTLAQTEIAATLAIERAHLVALLDQLEGLGLLVREADAKDRRRHAVRLTKKGTTTSEKVATLAREVEQQLLTGLSAREKEQLRTALRRLARDADEG